jgi:hypothetical protein
LGLQPVQAQPAEDLKQLNVGWELVEVLPRSGSVNMTAKVLLPVGGQFCSPLYVEVERMRRRQSQ